MNQKIILKNNALVFPSRKNDFGGGKKQGAVLFGIYDDLDPTSEIYNHKRLGVIWADLNDRDSMLEQAPTESIAGEWMYGGALFNHFGHFLSESIHRLWAYKYLENKVEGIIFHVPLHWINKNLNELPGYMIELFELFGLSDVPIRFIKNFSIVERLYIPEAGSFLGNNAYVWYKKELKKNLDIMPSDNLRKYEKVFFSRRNYLHKGRVLGTGYIEEIMRNNGFQIILPETLSLKEQVYIIANAEYIFFEEGSAVHLLDVVPQLSSKIYLLRRRSGLNYLDRLIKDKARSCYIFSDIVESKYCFEGDRRDNIASRLIDFEAFSRWLIETGLIKDDTEQPCVEKFSICEMKDMLCYLEHRVKEDTSGFNFFSIRGDKCQ